MTRSGTLHIVKDWQKETGNQSKVESVTLSTLAPQCRNQLGRAAWFLSSERYAWKTCTAKFSASWCDALRQGMETYPCSLSQFVMLCLSMFCGYGFLWRGVRTAPRGGIIQFYYRIESERRVDTLRFFIDETWQRDSLWRQTWAEIKARHNLEGRNWKWKAGFSTMLWVCSSNFKVSDMLELTCKRTSRPRKWNKQAMASQHQGRSCGPKSAFHFLGLACCPTISDGGMRSLVCTWRKHFWDVVKCKDTLEDFFHYNRTTDFFHWSWSEGKMVPTLLVQMLLALMRLWFTVFVALNESFRAWFAICETFEVFPVTASKREVRGISTPATWRKDALGACFGNRF